MVWILPARRGGTPALHLLPETDRGGIAVAQDADFAGALAGLGTEPVTVVPDPDAIAVPGAGSLLAVGTPAWAEAFVRRLMMIPEGGAQPVLAAGALTSVQLLPDRNVLLRLNDGRALG
jgi:hypothetical protein